MRSYRYALSGAILGAAALVAVPSYAETIFRLDAAAPGVVDPDKGIDYIGSVLAFNVYDALVAPGQNGTPVAPHIAKSWKIEGNDYIFTLRDDVKFHSGNPLDRRRRGVLLQPADDARQGQFAAVRRSR